MMNAFGERQQQLLKLLLKSKPEFSTGFTIDELAARLKITRPAARQHLMALERQRYVERGELLTTGGRPSQTYRLSAHGQELFPKQYSWFSEKILATLKKQLGSTGLKDFMRRLGGEVASQAQDQVAGATLPERVQQTAKLMTDLAYQAEASFTGKERAGAPPVIEATNCVYHALATQFPEVCEFDLALLTQLTGSTVRHEQCIVRGGKCCRFRFTPASS